MIPKSGHRFSDKIMRRQKEGDMIRLLGRQTSGNVQKVLFLLEEIQKPYTREDYGRQFNNTTTPEYKAMNPNSKVPTLVDGSTVIWESNAILRYLAASYAPNMTGATPAERTDVERWMDWLLASINAPYLALFRDAKKKPEERGADWAEQCKTMIELLSILDGHLASREWVALNKLTIADIALSPVIKRCLDFPTGRPALPNLEKWQAKIDARPAFQVATGAKPSTLAA
jgi:glutathione S-transferase